MILGITGALELNGKYVGMARAGKDTVANHLRDKHQFEVIALADKIKQICKEVFLFTDEQLWGSEKEIPDKRYPRPDGSFLTPRYAFKKLGTEWARDCYPDIWAEITTRNARGKVVIPDIRFDNEFSAIRRAGGKIIRVVRPVSECKIDLHVSDQEALAIPDCELDRVIRNNGTIEQLYLAIDRMVETL